MADPIRRLLPPPARMKGVRAPPGGLVDGQRRRRALRLAGGVDWYLAESGRFDFLGSGDLSLEDARAVLADLGAGSTAVFVCVAKPRAIEDVLGGESRWGLRRLTWSRRLHAEVAPKLASVARGARLALLPGEGLVWVDGERLFTPGELVPLPWTDPPVSLRVVRPADVLLALRRAVGPGGPRRAAVGGD